MVRLIGIGSDITLILVGDGVILDAALQSRQLLDALNDSAGWVSQTFGSIVAADSRTKTAALLQDAMGHAHPSGVASTTRPRTAAASPSCIARWRSAAVAA